MSVPRYEEDIGIDAVLEDLRRSIREDPTVPELPPSTSHELRAAAYFNLASASHDRFRRVVEALDKFKSHFDTRFDRLERMIAGERASVPPPKGAP